VDYNRVSDLQSRAAFWKNDRTAVHAEKRIRLIPVLGLSWKNARTGASVPGNHPFIGPVNFFCDASHLLIAGLYFCHSQRCFHQFQKLQQLCGFPSLHTNKNFTFDLSCIL
jgi:hypothetical protein